MDQGKDRTCLSEDKRVLQCPCPTLTIPDLLYCSGTVRIASHNCAPHLSEVSQGLSSFRHTHADGNRVAISMKKTVCRSTGVENCKSVLQAIEARLRWLAPNFQHTRLMPVRQTCDRFTARPFPFIIPVFYLDYISIRLVY